MASVHKKILIVEDDSRLRFVLVHQLRSFGYDTEATESAERGLEVAFTEVPLAVLLDIRLPGMDGFEMLRRLRHEEATAEVPVILLTDRTEGEDVLRGYNLGAAYYVPKPYRLHDLLRGLQLAGV